MSFNRVIIMGNLTRDPDYKQLSSGQAVCRLGIASNRQFKNKQNGDTIQEYVTLTSTYGDHKQKAAVSICKKVVRC